MAGDRRDNWARAQSGLKSELGDLGIVEGGELFGRRQARSDCGVADRIDGESPPVVGDLDADPPAFDRGDRHRDPAAARFPGRFAYLGRLDPVIDRVAHDVDERILHQIEDFAVHLERRADDLPGDVLPGLAAQVAHHQGERLEDARCRHHASTAHLFVEVVDAGSQRLAAVAQVSDKASRACFERSQLVADLQRFGRQPRANRGQLVDDLAGLLDLCQRGQLRPQEMLAERREPVQLLHVDANRLRARDGRGDGGQFGFGRRASTAGERTDHGRVVPDRCEVGFRQAAGDEAGEGVARLGNDLDGCDLRNASALDELTQQRLAPLTHRLERGEPDGARRPFERMRRAERCLEAAPYPLQIGIAANRVELTP